MKTDSQAQKDVIQALTGDPWDFAVSTLTIWPRDFTNCLMLKPRNIEIVFLAVTA